MDDPVAKVSPSKPDGANPGNFDRTEHRGPLGEPARRSRQPLSAEEEWEMIRRADEGERKASEQGKARLALMRLSNELDAARKANQADRVATLAAQREALALEIKANFG